MGIWAEVGDPPAEVPLLLGCRGKMHRCEGERIQQMVKATGNSAPSPPGQPAGHKCRRRPSPGGTQCSAEDIKDSPTLLLSFTGYSTAQELQRQLITAYTKQEVFCFHSKLPTAPAAEL